MVTYVHTYIHRYIQHTSMNNDYYTMDVFKYTKAVELAKLRPTLTSFPPPTRGHSPPLPWSFDPR
jgi:hypothetical protein